MWLRNVKPVGWLRVAYLLLAGAGVLGAFCLLRDRDASAARKVTYHPTRTQHYPLLFVCRRTSVRLEIVGCVLAPLLVMLLLVHIVLPDAGRDWPLPVTSACCSASRTTP